MDYWTVLHNVSHDPADLPGPVHMMEERVKRASRSPQASGTFCWPKQIIKPALGNSLAVQWLGFGAFTAVGPGFDPWSGN